MGVLARAAGLLLVAEVELDRLGRALAVGDLRLADQAFALVLAANPLDVDFEVQLAHAGNQRLARFLVGHHAEGRILAAEPLEGLAEAVGPVALHRLDREAEHRLGDEDAFEGHVDAVAAERVARGAVDADDGDDVACLGFIDVFTFVGMHADQTAEADFLARPLVRVAFAFDDRPLVDAAVGELAERLHDRLEGHADERIAGRRGERLSRADGRHFGDGGFLLVFGFLLFLDGLGLAREIDRLDLAVFGAGEEGQDGVQQFLHALVAEGGPHHDRREFLREGGFADQGADFSDGTGRSSSRATIRSSS